MSEAYKSVLDEYWMDELPAGAEDNIKEGILSPECVSQKTRKPILYGASIFPDYISMSRVGKIADAYGGSYYNDTTVAQKYGPGYNFDMWKRKDIERGMRTVSYVIDHNYILPRSVDVKWQQRGYSEGSPDEWISIENHIPPEEIVGIICHEEDLEKVVSVLREHKKEIPVYDPYGNLLWPRKITAEEVEELVKERLTSKQ